MSFHHSNSSSTGGASSQPGYGWICFVLPEGWQHTAIWRVRIGETIGEPGVRMIAPVGTVRVMIEVMAALPGFQAQGTLTVDAEVHPDGLTELTLPLASLLKLAADQLAQVPQE
ncbi:MAG: hypothetical protein JOZ51_28030 [Chloroflexi bacterium]|nr:hypothetical protein [Chloroflexota bacterium]